jgi:hypothetical protein
VRDPAADVVSKVVAVEVLLGVLRRGGFEGRPLLLAYGAVLNHAYTYAASEAAAGAGGADQARSMADALATSLPPDRFPNLIGVARSMADLTADEQFDFGLQRLLDGFESLLSRPQPVQGGRVTPT